jgi:hypothetical protein
MGRHYDCVNDTPMRALCGFVLWAESVIGTGCAAWRALMSASVTSSNRAALSAIAPSDADGRSIGELEITRSRQHGCGTFRYTWRGPERRSGRAAPVSRMAIGCSNRNVYATAFFDQVEPTRS